MLIQSGEESTTTIPFRFQLSVKDVQEQPRSDAFRSLQRAAAWAQFWEDLVTELADPKATGLIRSEAARDNLLRARDAGGPWFDLAVWERLTLVHPSALFAFPEAGASFSLPRPMTPPRPDIGFAFELTARPAERVRRGPEVFCVALDGSSVLFEVGFDELQAWLGSTETKGSGTFSFKANLIQALLVALLTPIGALVVDGAADRASTYMRSVAIERTYHDTVNGSQCLVQGTIEFDTSALVDAPWQHLNVWEASLSAAEKHRRVCNLQAALVAVTRRPLAVDGKMGPRTLEVLQGFKQEWHLGASTLDNPAVVTRLADALAGKKP